MPMTNPPDLRQLDEIPFREEGDAVRSILRLARCAIGEEVIAAGCTGLVLKLVGGPAKSLADALEKARFVREHMGGAGFGLPCYITPMHFCLVHNTVGGLQRGQQQQFAEGIRLCSRELTAEEREHAAVVEAKIAQDGLREGEKHFGVEPYKEKVASECNMPPPSANAVPVQLLSGYFRCPEHTEIEWKCRYCLAAAVLQGPLEPVTEVQIKSRTATRSTVEIERLAVNLDSENSEVIEVYVRVRRWARKLVVEE